jgi:serine/threonine protein kinase
MSGTDGREAVLADFGLSIPLDEHGAAAHTATGSVGSTRWQAPELHDPEQYGLKEAQRTQASDIYSFGCLCLEVPTVRLLKDDAAHLGPAFSYSPARCRFTTFGMILPSSCVW